MSARPYYGWVIVGIAFLASMLVLSCTLMSFGLFVKPVSAEFGLSRATMNTGLIILNIGLAIYSPILGRLADRMRMRPFLAASGVTVGLSLVGLGLSESLWLNALILAVPLSAAFSGSAALAGFVLIARWFKYQRGRAMAIAAVGQSIGGIVILPLLAKLIDAVGWRQTLIIEGIGLAIIILLLAFFIRERPGAGDIELVNPPATAASYERTLSDSRIWTIPELLRSKQFWGINVAVAIALSVSTTLTATIVPLGQESGLTLLQATSLLSTLTVSAIFGKLVLAVFVDKMEQRAILAGAFILLAALTLALSADHGYVSLLTCCLIGGLATGALYPLLISLLAQVFGSASYGTVAGLKSPLIGIITAVYVRLIGEIYDRTGGYDIAFYSFAASLVVAVVMILATRSRRDAGPPPVSEVQAPA